MRAKIAKGQRGLPYQVQPYHAEYSGTCQKCGGDIEVGQVIQRVVLKLGFVHTVCPGESHLAQ